MMSPEFLSATLTSLTFHKKSVWPISTTLYIVVIQPRVEVRIDGKTSIRRLETKYHSFQNFDFVRFSQNHIQNYFVGTLHFLLYRRWRRLWNVNNCHTPSWNIPNCSTFFAFHKKTVELFSEIIKIRSAIFRQNGESSPKPDVNLVGQEFCSLYRKTAARLFQKW